MDVPQRQRKVSTRDNHSVTLPPVAVHPTNTMGNVQPLARTSGALDAFVSELTPDIVYEKRSVVVPPLLPNSPDSTHSIGQARFLKTAKCRHRNGPLVVKIFIKHDPAISLKAYHRKQKGARPLLSHSVPDPLHSRPRCSPRHPQRVHLPGLCRNRQGGLSRPPVDIQQPLRPHQVRSQLAIVHATHHPRSTRPFLAVIEKKWIVYQLLTALSLAHLQHTPHGDIKSTNILVTSSNWIYLTDFAPYKPTRLPLDDPSDFSFFYDTSGRRTCYLAPERFYKVSIDQPDPNDRVTEPMDVFSAGCVIAEMFLEGAPLFTLSQLFKYREGEYTVDAQLATIDDQGIRASVL